MPDSQNASLPSGSTGPDPSPGHELPSFHSVAWEADVDLRRFCVLTEDIESLLGYLRKEWRADPSFLPALLDPSERDQILSAIRGAVAAGLPFSVEAHLRRPDSSYGRCVLAGRALPGTVERLSGTLTDLVSIDAAHQNFRERQVLERAITAISTRFVNLATEETDTAIDEALRLIGECLCVDRVLLFRWDGSGAHLDVTHEWCTPLVGSVRAEIQQAALAHFPWSLEIMRRVGYLSVADSHALPPEARQLRELLEQRRVRATLFVPIRYGDAQGGLALSSISVPREWSEGLVPLLRFAAEIFAGALVRREAEAALRVSEARYRAIIEDQAELVCRNLPDCTLTFVNDAYCRFFGRTRAELIGTSFLPLIPAEDRGVMQKLIRTLTPEHPFATHEHRVIRGDGQVTWQQWTNRGFFDSSGVLLEMQAVGRDITERKEIEARLAESEQTYRTLIEENPGTVALVADGKIFYTNQVVSRLSGYTPEEMQGRSPLDFIAPQDRERAAERIRALLDGAAPQSSEYHVLTKDGTLRIAEIRTQRISFHGRTALLTIIQDIEQRKRAEQELRDSEQAYRTLIEENPGIVLLMADGKVLYTNQALSQLGGYAPEEMRGRSPMDFIAPEDRERAAARMQSLLDGTPASSAVYRLLAKDGSIRVMELHTQRIQFHGRTALLTVMHDVEERQQAEEAERRRREELERLVAERTAHILELERQRAAGESMAATGRMAARIAHEINNPLAGIKNAFRLVKDAVPGDHQYASYVALIDREIDRIAGIVRQMYDLYRPDQDKPRPTALDTVIRDVLTVLEGRCEDRRVRIACDTVPAAVLHLPPGHLNQVLLNVIQNAIEASPPDGIVRVQVTTGDDHLTIEVADQGPGVPEPLHTRIFEPFFTTKGSGPQAGLGLGLSVTRGLMEAMGGRIEFVSPPGEGATFRLIFPRTRGRGGNGNG